MKNKCNIWHIFLKVFLIVLFTSGVMFASNYDDGYKRGYSDAQDKGSYNYDIYNKGDLNYKYGYEDGFNKALSEGKLHKNLNGGGTSSSQISKYTHPEGDAREYQKKYSSNSDSLTTEDSDLEAERLRQERDRLQSDLNPGYSRGGGHGF